MSVALDQIARLAASLSLAGRARIVIEVEPEGNANVGTGSRLSPTRERTLARDQGHTARACRATIIKWLEREISRYPAPGFSFELLDSAEVGRRLARAGLQPLRGKAVNALLKFAGFVYLGTMQGPMRTAKYWSIYPERFLDQNGKLLTRHVREYLQPL